MIVVADGFTNVKAAPDEIPQLIVERFVCTAPPVLYEHAAIEAPASVTVEVARSAPVVPE